MLPGEYPPHPARNRSGGGPTSAPPDHIDVRERQRLLEILAGPHESAPSRSHEPVDRSSSLARIVSSQSCLRWMARKRGKQIGVRQQASRLLESEGRESRTYRRRSKALVSKTTRRIAAHATSPAPRWKLEPLNRLNSHHE